jgi:hypothetical protein
MGINVMVTKVNDLGKLRSDFYLLSLGALRGITPAEGGSVRLAAFGDNSLFYKLCGRAEAWGGDFPPLLFF